MGARSKLLGSETRLVESATRLPLWGRDQNFAVAAVKMFPRLPDCPCGGEIKTAQVNSPTRGHRYQTAPVGARSKHAEFFVLRLEFATRLPLWGRDQNHTSKWLKMILGYQTAPVGARSKLHQRFCLRDSLATRLPLWGRDQNSTATPTADAHLATRLPLWGRDQNGEFAWKGNYLLLPDCPCGGEIKTLLPCDRSGREVVEALKTSGTVGGELRWHGGSEIASR